MVCGKGIVAHALFFIGLIASFTLFALYSQR
jgi:hypothetical protein